MLRTRIRFSMLLASLILVGIASTVYADVEKLEIYISGFVTQDDARQIRRLLRPWVDAEDVSFRNAVDEKGRERYFTTVVEITPRRPSVDVYSIERQLRDQRFRGRQAGSQPLALVTKAEVTITGQLFAHAGWSRSYIRNVPSWRSWRGETSDVNFAFDTGWAERPFVFSQNEQLDELIQEAGKGQKMVEVKGQLAGFDGNYPVMSVRKFRVEYVVEPTRQAPTPAQGTPEYLSEEEQ